MGRKLPLDRHAANAPAFPPPPPPPSELPSIAMDTPANAVAAAVLAPPEKENTIPNKATTAHSRALTDDPQTSPSPPTTPTSQSVATFVPSPSLVNNHLRLRHLKRTHHHDHQVPTKPPTPSLVPSNQNQNQPLHTHQRIHGRRNQQSKDNMPPATHGPQHHCSTKEPATTTTNPIVVGSPTNSASKSAVLLTSASGGSFSRGINAVSRGQSRPSEKEHDHSDTTAEPPSASLGPRTPRDPSSADQKHQPSNVQAHATGGGGPDAHHKIHEDVPSPRTLDVSSVTDVPPAFGFGRLTSADSRKKEDIAFAMDLELCCSSDEEEEFREAVASFLRVKSPAEIELAAATASEVTSKQARIANKIVNATAKHVRGEKRLPRKEIPFSVPAHRKLVALGLPDGEVDQDLLIMVGASSPESGTPVHSTSLSDRQRSGHIVRRQTQALRKQDQKHLFDVKLSTAEAAILLGNGPIDNSLPDLAASRSTKASAVVDRGSDLSPLFNGRKRRRGAGSKAVIDDAILFDSGAAPERGASPSGVISSGRKRARPGTGRPVAGAVLANSPASSQLQAVTSGKAVDGRNKQFVKHMDKKGWVICRKCRSAVWPPNCAKHVQHCKSQGA